MSEEYTEDQLDDMMMQEAELRHRAKVLMEKRMRAENNNEDRDYSYEPPFSGSRPQTTDESETLHERWVKSLKRTWPEGIPVAKDGGGREPYADTFGEVEGHPVAQRLGYSGCFQCGSCQYYIPLESRHGSDWGACSNPNSQYDRSCTFEHWTCKEFTP